MKLIFAIASFALTLLTACSINTPPLPAATASPAPSATSTHTPALTATATIAPAQAHGTLAGHVIIGPLQPAQRVGVPTPTPRPEIFAVRSINIFAADGVTLVTNVKINPDGTYSVTLPPGTFVINIARTGIDRARNLPNTITLESGKTVQLDIEIDTGIR